MYHDNYNLLNKKNYLKKAKFTEIQKKRKPKKIWRESKEEI